LAQPNASKLYREPTPPGVYERDLAVVWPDAERVSVGLESKKVRDRRLPPLNIPETSVRSDRRQD
jgi:hypothetical protein